jgi:hypothetical protein
MNNNEIEGIKSSNGKKYWLLVLIFSVVIILTGMGGMFFYSAKMIAASKEKLETLNKKAESFDFKAENGKNDLFFEPELFELYRERTYKESYLKLTKQDSMGLVINLQDSSLTLLISGIPVFNTKAKSVDISGVFKNLSPKAYLYYFRKPFIVDSCNATFEKEPITRKEAPKDTLEAASFFSKPDTTLNFRLVSNYHLGYGFKLTLEQALTNSKEDKNYILKNKMNHFKESFKRVFTMKKPEYETNIVVYLKASDVMVIYRALPQHANIVIYPY